MIARYWARDLLGEAPPAAHDAVTAAIALRLRLHRRPAPTARRCATRSRTQRASGRRARAGRQARGAARPRAAVPAIAFVHSYGPLADVSARFALARATGLPLWINRYGYLSDAKLAMLRGVAGST